MGKHVEGVTLSMEELLINGCYKAEDVLFKEILAKLPVKSVTRFKSVCKAWSARLSSDSFVADHLHHHSATEKSSEIIRGEYSNSEITDLKLFRVADFGESDAEEMDMSYVEKADIKYFSLEGSSNGLILIQQFYTSKDNSALDESDEEDSYLTLWNPAIRDFKNLPEPIDPGFDAYYDNILGFGNDYKVVRVGRDSESGLCHHFQLFTRNTGHWRELGSLSDRTSFVEQVVVDGFVHWVMLLGEVPAKGSQFKILTFNLNTEELMEIDGPASQSHNEYLYFRIIEWKGSLGALMTKVGGETEFWVKNKTLCWAKMSISKAPVSKLGCRAVLKNKFLLFDHHIKRDVLFDPVTQTQTLFPKEYGDINFYDFHHYLPSLISPAYHV